MEKITHKNIITGLVVIFELLGLYYFSPRIGLPGAVFFESVGSRVCINTEDLFVADRRCHRVRQKLWGMDERLLMYYADLTPKRDKEYLLYFEPIPPRLDKYYDLNIEKGTKVYLLKGFTWDKFINAFANKDLMRGDEPYVARRKA